MRFARPFAIVFWFALQAGAVYAQEQSKAAMTTCSTNGDCATISEPASVSIENLHKQADVVALVQIVSGDTENYEAPVYKAKVLRAFKGSAVGQYVYIGKFIGYQVGGEYLAFLRRSEKVAAPVRPGGLNYGEVKVLQIMYEGYSFMLVTYECIFAGKTTAEQCDYGVQISTNQVLLPKSVKAYSLGTRGGGGPHYMVRRDSLLDWIEKRVKTK